VEDGEDTREKSREEGGTSNLRGELPRKGKRACRSWLVFDRTGEGVIGEKACGKTWRRLLFEPEKKRTQSAQRKQKSALKGGHRGSSLRGNRGKNGWQCMVTFTWAAKIPGESLRKIYLGRFSMRRWGKGENLSITWGKLNKVARVGKRKPLGGGGEYR